MERKQDEVTQAVTNFLESFKRTTTTNLASFDILGRIIVLQILDSTSIALQYKHTRT